MSIQEVGFDFTIVKKIIVLSFIIVMIASYVLAMILGPMILFTTESGEEIVGLNVRLDFFIFGVPHPIPFNFNVGSLFIVCWVIYWGTFVTSYFSGEKFHKLLKKEGSYTYKDFVNNFLFSMPVTLSLLYTALVALALLQVVLGIPFGPTVVAKEPHQLMVFFHLTYSPIAEEIGFRLIPLGLLTTVGLLLVSRKCFKSRIAVLKVIFLGFVFPDKAKEFIGTNSVWKKGPFRGISLYEWIGVFVTAAVFGISHYYFGAWNVGKIVTSSILGVALGLAYLVYGIHASILMHWWFNYYFETYFQAYRLVPTVPWISVISLLWFGVLIGGSIGWMLIGHTKQVDQ